MATIPAVMIPRNGRIIAKNIEHHEHEQCGNEPLADLLRGDATAADADLATGI